MKKPILIILCLLLVSIISSLAGCKEKPDDGVSPGDWIQLKDFDGAPRSLSASCVIGTKGYMFAGYDGEEYFGDLWEYNSETDSWKKLADFPGAKRVLPVAFSLNNKVYVGLGTDGMEYFKDFWEYDPATDTWLQKADFKGISRCGSIGFGVDGMGYIGWGYDGDFYDKDLYRYDPVNNSWTETTEPGSARFSGASFIHNGFVYIVGGMTKAIYVYDFWRFDPSTQTWVELNHIADKTEESWDDSYTDIARERPLTFVIGDKAYLTSGKRIGSISAITWEYDIENDRWHRVADFGGINNSIGVSFSFGNRGIITTGQLPDNKCTETWEFLPDAAPETSR